MKQPHKYYEDINNYILPYDTAIIPSTYRELKHIITFSACTMDGDIYYYFIDTFNKSATMQELSHISINNPIGCTEDFIDLFKKIDYDEKKEEEQKLSSKTRKEFHQHIFRRFNYHR